MKATEFKCPACGDVPTADSWEWSLIEPAVAIRRLAIEISADGTVTNARTQDLSHDEGDGESIISHRCAGAGEIKIPKGFWDFDVYG